MDKVKIQEIADEAGLSNDNLLEAARELGFDIKEANSTISMEDAGVLVDYAISGRLPKGFKKPNKPDKVLKEKNPPPLSFFEKEEKNRMNNEHNEIKKENEMNSDNLLNAEILSKKKKELEKYHKKIIEQNNQLKKVQQEFENKKKEQENALKIKLEEKELNHQMKLEEQKTKIIAQLKTEFLENIKNEYDKVNSKLDELTQKELKLSAWQQEVDSLKKVLTQDKELFESQKDKLLGEYLQELEKMKEISNNQLEEEKVKKFEEVNQKIKILYESKEKEIEEKEVSLREQDATLKTNIAEISAKEKYLESQEELLEKKAFEKVQEEIKNYQEKLSSFESANQLLREELAALREELDSYEKIEDRDLPLELSEKQQEITRLKKALDDSIKMKNDLKMELYKANKESEEKRKELYLENEDMKKSIEDTERFRSDNELLKEKVNSNNNHIEFLQGENKDLNDRLKSIYSDGTEIEERIKDIKEKPYKTIQLDTPIGITEEIKYLDAIEEGMKDYGVVYPKRLLYAFHTALKSADFSPLTVLSGVSGTGKSELPKLYSHFGGFNFLSEAVQPTWDSPASMIGYYNTIDRKFDSTNILKFLLQTSQSKNESPFGLKESMNMILLDEMNLAHIELYFAEFLSKFELRRGSSGVNLDIQLGTALNYPLPLDKNVLWIGTMNEDETTKSLSDKVLDRAFSINFPRPTELKSRAKLQTLDEIKQFEYLHRDTWDKWIQKESLFTGDKSEVLQKYKEMSNQINYHLAPTGRAIGHRVWQSIEYYMNNHPLVIQNIDNDDELAKNVKLAFEEQLVQKIMPKLRGIEVHGKEKESLMRIKNILNQNDFKITEDFELSMDNPYGQFIWNSANYLKED
jgi:hypothetical protein